MKSITIKALAMFCIALLFSACGEKQVNNAEERVSEQPEEQKENKQNMNNKEVENEEKRKPTVPGDLDKKRAEYFGKVLTGSWTDGYFEGTIERDVSWGKIKINESQFFIFDFLVSKPLIIWGASEGGPPIDQDVGRIVGMDIENNSIWLYYRAISSWSPFQTNPETGNNWFTAYEPSDEETLGSDIKSLHIWYNEESDTISVDPETMIGGISYSRESKLKRVSKRVQ
jgi:hypothetical protein